MEIAPQQILSDDPQFPLELRISVYPSLLAPGDIREIGLSLCERRSFYGCYIIDFPQGQFFDAAITWDPFPGENDYNTPKLVSGTQISDTLLGVEEGFYFKAPEYLTVSYMVAVLEVKTYISGYGLIQDDYLVSMMLDTSLVISFNPANISPSDTSEIVIEKIRSDGVKIPYHPLQQFEVGIIEGCTAGKLLAAGDTASYFNRVTQPIYFVAADSIDEEEDTLKIRVGLNQELIDTYLPLKIKYEKQLAKQEKEERGELKVTEEEKPVEQNPTDNPMISSCSFSTFESFLYEDVTKTLQDECDFPMCGENQPNYTFSLQTHENSFIKSEVGTIVEVCNSSNVNELGGSQPVEYLFMRQNIAGDWVKNWVIEYCLNSNNEIQYKLVNPSSPEPIEVPIVFDFVRDRCINKIGNRTLITNLIEVDTKIQDNPNDAMEDFCGHYCYTLTTREYGYVIEAVIIEHENSHRDQYQEIIDNSVNENFFNKILNLKYDCNTYNKFVDNPEQDVLNIIGLYVEECIIAYYRKSGKQYPLGVIDPTVPADPKVEEANEKIIQLTDNVIRTIGQYIWQLEFFKSIKRPMNCISASCSTN